MSRSSHSHWLVGSSTSVLKEDFVSSYHHGDSLAGVEPFSGKLMLPTKLQTLKLNLFLKDEARRKNSTVTPGQITSKVTEVIKHYWSLAGYETLSSPKNKIAKLVKMFVNIKKVWPKIDTAAPIKLVKLDEKEREELVELPSSSSELRELPQSIIRCHLSLI